ncbi:hypothetical protein HGRIS_005268 [Hohenbuehelia grisea]|uniref:Uncharacterized protein n=1 Tax=Hohenbuehelia grisea TaxID=104357 RepID=A0ABR3JEZ5_9AGAR
MLSTPSAYVINPDNTLPIHQLDATSKPTQAGGLSFGLTRLLMSWDDRISSWVYGPPVNFWTPSALFQALGIWSPPLDSEPSPPSLVNNPEVDVEMLDDFYQAPTWYEDYPMDVDPPLNVAIDSSRCRQNVVPRSNGCVPELVDDDSDDESDQEEDEEEEGPSDAPSSATQNQAGTSIDPLVKNDSRLLDLAQLEHLFSQWSLSPEPRWRLEDLVADPSSSAVNAAHSIAVQTFIPVC